MKPHHLFKSGCSIQCTWIRLGSHKCQDHAVYFYKVSSYSTNQPVFLARCHFHRLNEDALGFEGYTIIKKNDFIVESVMYE